MSRMIQRDMFPVFTTGVLPDLYGTAAYVIMIRDGQDPSPPTKAEKHSDRDKAPHLTLRKQEPKLWRDGFLRVLADGQPRTFNALCVILAGMTADICGGELPEQVLWELVKERIVEYTMVAPIMFRLVGAS